MTTATLALDELARTIDQAWENRDGIGLNTRGAVREAVDAAIEALDSGSVRVPSRDPPAGRSTNGSRRPCCCRSGSTIPR
jgi:hypothetical protein